MITSTGTSLTLYGDVIGDGISNSAAYQVDGAKSVTFPLSSALGNATNQLLFTVPLSAGEHTVTVAFNGSQSGPPLDVNYFLVTSLTQAEQAPSLSNGSETSNGTNGTSSGGGTSSGNESSSGSSSNAAGHTEALILKAVLGSVVPVIFLVILFNIIWLRVGRRRREKALNLLAAEPFAFEKTRHWLDTSTSIKKTHYDRCVFSRVCRWVSSENNGYIDVNS